MTAQRIIDLIPGLSSHVRPDTTLGEAAAQMIGDRVSSVIVVDAERAVGIVTESDMLHAMREHRSVGLLVAAVMTAPVHTVQATVDFRAAYREAARLGIRHIVVADDSGLPVGVVSESDFRRHLGADFFRHLHDVETLMDRLFPRLSPDASLDSALVAMEATRATCAVVVEGRRPVGIVTERDVVRLFLKAADNPPLSSVMTRPPITVDEHCSLAAAAERMNECAIRHLVVVNAAGDAVGLLSEHTLMRPLELDLVDDVLAERRELSQSRDAVVRDSKRSELYQRALLDNFPFLVWLKDTESCFLEVNRAFSQAVGEPSAGALIGKTDRDYFPVDLAEHYRSDDAAVMADRRAKVVVEPIFVQQKAVLHETYKAPVIGEDGRLLGTVGFARDISAKKRAEEAMLLRNAALSGLIRGDGLVGVFELIALSIEAEMTDWMCAVLLADEAGRRLTCVAAPRLPDEYVAAADGVAIAEGVGACGTAAALRERVVVEDVFQHPHWASFRTLARQCGFSACWAEPILGPQGELLGVFAAYHTLPARPSDDDLAQLRQASQLAGLVIAHQRSASRLESSLETFRGIFNSVSEALFILAEDGGLLDVNSGAEQLSGYPRRELIGRAFGDFAAAGLNDQAAAEQYLAAAFAGTPQIFEYWTETALGRILPIEVRLTPGDYFGRRVVIASVLDISERKNAALQFEIEHDLAQALAGGLPRDDVYGVILRAAMRFHEFDAGAIYVRRPDGGFRLVVQHGYSPTFIAAAGDYAADSPRAALVRAGTPVCSCRSAKDECGVGLLDENPATVSEGLNCVAILPVAVAGEAVAFLHLGGRRTTQVSGVTMQALGALGRNFGQTLARLAEMEEARRRQQNLSGLFDAMDDFIIVADRSGRIVHHNRALAEGLGYGPTALIGKPAAELHPLAHRETAHQLIREITAGQRSSCSLPMLRADGASVMVETRVVSGSWNGQPAFFAIAQDISERLIAEERQKLAASVFDNAHEGIMITDPQGRIIEVNGTFTELTGYTRHEAVGQSAELLKSGHHDPDFYHAMWQTIHEVGYWRGEVWNRKKSGEIFVELLTISTVRNRNGEISQFVGIFSDITLLKQHQQRLEHLAHFDALTQLPNRMLLGDRMQTAMAQTERSGKILAVCYLDLDGFKPVNDLHGHAVGDRLLVEVAQRLKTCVRAGDTVSRLGGDEFVLLFSGLDSVHECDHAVARIIATLTQPFMIDGNLIAISASIGVTLYPHDGSDSDALLRHADQAMYAAKQAGRNRYHLFDPESDRRARLRRDELSRLREGLVRGEFALYYQPKVNMRAGSVIGAEALIRWHHPEFGVMQPGQFLPALEGSELAIELGDWVIREALQQMDDWRRQGLNLAVSVNIAGNHLQSPGFVRRLGELLAGFPDLSPAMLELEILETAALEDIVLAADIFAACRQLGVGFALDDFGTGYSSLTYFRRLPADTLKIDQSFVRDMLDDPDDLAIVEGVIGLTQAFRRKVIAEGVESVEHGLVLLLLGCDVAQGYGIAHPMPAAELPAWAGQFRPDAMWSSAAAVRWSREDLPMLIAEVEHGRWKKRLYAYLADGTLSPPAGDHRSCRFGRWYYGRESRQYAALEAFVALEAVHEELHRIGNEMIAANADSDPARLAHLQVALEQRSSELIGLLHQIQAEAVIPERNSQR